MKKYLIAIFIGLIAAACSDNGGGDDEPVVNNRTAILIVLETGDTNKKIINEEHKVVRAEIGLAATNDFATNVVWTTNSLADEFFFAPVAPCEYALTLLQIDDSGASNHSATNFTAVKDITNTLDIALGGILTIGI